MIDNHRKPPCSHENNGSVSKCGSDYFHVENGQYPPNEPTPFVPNPVPVVEPGEPPKCPHHPLPPRPIHWDQDFTYVTKHELNRVLQNIAKADIFTDTSVNGTTVSVGGVPKGTKFTKITFAQLVEKLLYPKHECPTDFVTREELAIILAKVAFSGNYADLNNKPTNFDYVYPNNLNHEVVRNLGGFSVGDSLTGMTISKIIEKLLCEETPGPVPPGPDIWGEYEWISDIYDLQTGDIEIPLDTFAPLMIRDMENAKAISQDTYRALLTSGKYELHLVCHTYDKGDQDKYNTQAIIASEDSFIGPNPQTTIPLDGDTPQELTWIYDDDDKLIRILGGSIMDDICILMIKR